MRVIETTLSRLQDVLESLPKTNLSHSNYSVSGCALDKPGTGYDSTNFPDEIEFYYESGGWVCANAIIVIDPKNE